MTDDNSKDNVDAMFVSTEDDGTVPPPKVTMTTTTYETTAWTRCIDLCDSCLDWGKYMLQFLAVGLVCFALGWVYRDWQVTRHDLTNRIDAVEEANRQQNRDIFDLRWRVDEYHGNQ